MSFPRHVVVVGRDAELRACMETLEQLNAVGRAVPLDNASDSAPDVASLTSYPPDEWFAFAAVGPSLLNLKRLGLMSSLRAAGYRMANIVSPNAVTPPGWNPTENLFLDNGVQIGTGTRILHNVSVQSGAIVGRDCDIGHSVWIGRGAILGDRVSIGDGTVLAPGAVVADGVKIGKQCEIAIAQRVLDDVPDRSFYSHLFEDVVRILGPQSKIR